MESGLKSFLMLFLAAVAAATWYAFGHFYGPRVSAKKAQKEPPLFPHPIPYVGHILGLLRHGTRYYEMTRSIAPLLSIAEELSANHSCNAVRRASFPSTL